VLVQQLSNKPVFLLDGDSRAVPDTGLAVGDCIHRFVAQSEISDLLGLTTDEPVGRADQWGICRELGCFLVPRPHFSLVIRMGGRRQAKQPNQ
jgi:hypothetical protein